MRMFERDAIVPVYCCARFHHLSKRAPFVRSGRD